MGGDYMKRKRAGSADARDARTKCHARQTMERMFRPTPEMRAPNVMPVRQWSACSARRPRCAGEDRIAPVQGTKNEITARQCGDEYLL